MKFIEAKTILSGYAANNAWFGCNYNMNIYKGCCHGCIYCDSRSECYRIADFEEVRAKKDALAILGRELRAKRKTGVIGTGSMSDPYNPFEREYQLTKGALELIDQYRFGVAIVTKSDLVTRDLALLQKIKSHSPVLVKVTITTCDDSLCKKVEPNVAVASARFAAINQLAKGGIFTGILMMPVLPFLEDNEANISGIIRRAAENGAKFIYPAFGVTLRQNQREWYYRKLDEHFPGFRQKYLRYGNSYECHSPKAEELRLLFQEECKRWGIFYQMDEIVNGYRQGYEEQQLSLF